jgi:hypothetical protein
VQLESNFAGKLDQTTFKEMVNVLSFAVLHELWIAPGGMLDVLQRIEQRLQLRGGEHTGARECTCVRPAGGNLLREKSFVERKRPLPLLEFRIQRPAKPA